MSELLTKEQIDLMLKDAASLKCFASNCDRIVGPVMFDCECHIKALACDHKKLRAVADADCGMDLGGVAERCGTARVLNL